MEITEFSFPCTVVVAAYGYELSLVSVVEGNGILFTADLRQEEIQQDFNQLPETDKDKLKGTIGSIKNPEQESENISSEDVSILTEALNRINVKNIAYYWDRTNHKGLFYLELKLDLSNTVSLFGGNFEVDYLLFDLIISTGNQEVSDEDRARKEKIKGIRAKIWKKSEEENRLNELIKGIHKKESLLQEGLRSFQENTTRYTKSIEGFRQTLFLQDSLRENLVQKRFDEVEHFNREKSNEIFSMERNMLQLNQNSFDTSQNEQKALYTEKAFAQYQNPDLAYREREKDFEILTEKLKENQVLEKQYAQLNQIALHQEPTLEEQLIKLKEEKKEEFDKLPEITNFEEL